MANGNIEVEGCVKQNLLQSKHLNKHKAEFNAAKTCKQEKRTHQLPKTILAI